MIDLVEQHSEQLTALCCEYNVAYSRFNCTKERDVIVPDRDVAELVQREEAIESASSPA